MPNAFVFGWLGHGRSRRPLNAVVSDVLVGEGRDFDNILPRVMAGSLIGLILVSLLCNLIAPEHELMGLPWYWQAILGGFVFGTVFLATDPVAGPMTDPGRWGYGLLVGGLTVVIRVGNPSHYEGVIFAILLASMFAPLIDYMVTELNIRRRRLRMQEVGHE